MNLIAFPVRLRAALLVAVSCALIATVTFISGPRFNGSIDDGNKASVAGFDDHAADLTGPFTDHRSDPNPGDTIFDWHRTFDDGNSSIEPNLIHTWTAGGRDPVGAIDRASATRAVTQPNAPPIVTLTAPPDGAVYLAPAQIVVQTIARDPDGTVEKVLVYVNDSVLGPHSVPEDSGTWDGVLAGVYQLKAVAVDNEGAEGVSEVVTVIVTGETENGGEILLVTRGRASGWR